MAAPDRDQLVAWLAENESGDGPSRAIVASVKDLVEQLLAGEQGPDHEFLSLNYRMSELQAAVALAQMEKLEENLRKREASVAVLRETLAGTPGIRFPEAADGSRHVYWRIPLMVVESGIHRAHVAEFVPPGWMSAAPEVDTPQFRPPGNYRYFSRQRPQVFEVRSSRDLRHPKIRVRLRSAYRQGAPF